MNQRTLGKTGLKVSEIGFGAWAIGGTWWGGADDIVSLDALRRALDLGVDFIDTAAVYGMGRSERLIAQVRRERGPDAFRVASKVPPKNMQWPPAPGTKISEAFPAAWIREKTEESLKNLGMDCLDLQQLHVWSPDWVRQSDWHETLDKLRREGKVRFIGVSLNDHAPDEALELVASGLVDAIQVIYNIFDQTPQDRLLPLCLEKKVGVLARVPLDEGALTGKFTEATRFPEGDFRAEYFDPPTLKEAVKRVKALEKRLVPGEAPDMAAAALKFCLSHPAVSTVIPGIRNPRQAELNCRAADGRAFGPKLIEELKEHRWIHG